MPENKFPLNSESGIKLKKHIYFKRLVSAAVITILLLNCFVGYKAYSAAEAEMPDDNGYESIYLMMNVIQLIRRNYVDAGKVTYPVLITGALKGMLQELDPFSSFLEPESYSKLIKDAEGEEFGGVGMHITIRELDQGLEVTAPIEDSPAFKAGVKPGDLILAIEGKSTRLMSLDECVRLLKGTVGTEVMITIYRKSEDLTKELTIKREKIKVFTVKGERIIEDGIGYFRITQFNIPTAEKLDETLKKLKEQNMRALIVDLRGNPGGLLSSAVDVCSRFLEYGSLIVYTEGRMASDRIEYRSQRCDKTLDIPMAILVDGNSASASEIVSGCLQDHKRAVLIGEKTFGKGSVQTIYPLSDCSAVRLTTAKYYTPSKRIIHENGIEPDINIHVAPELANELYYQRIAYPGVVKPDVPDSVCDVQLEHAIEIVKGICLFSDAANSR